MKSINTLLAPVLLAGFSVLLCRPVVAATVVLPLEVMGVPSAEAVARVELTPAQAASAKRLRLVLHGLSYEQQASIRLNSGPWVPLNNKTCTVENSARFYGGIGGPITNIWLSLPAEGVVSGTNTFVFRFNGTDGVSSGYRVRGIDFLTENGQRLLNGSGFEEEDPSTWKPVRNSSAAITAGKKLWYTASLRKNGLPGAPMMEARCTDCHAQDGRDLKYFNFSSFSIEKRAQFHGLSQIQSEQISSYIRSLDVPNPGRPWDPPFQPGPGTDQKDLGDWSAGAGLDAVLPNDADSLPYIFPNGISSEPLREETPLNFREIPIAFELPDWNHWLPRIHPKDAWGEAFTNDLAAKYYDGTGSAKAPFVLRKTLSEQPNAKYVKGNLHFLFGYWTGSVRTFVLSRTANNATWTRDFTEGIHSVRLWQLVKTWELQQEFQLDGLGKNAYGSQAETRNWFTWALWQTAPFDWARSRRVPIYMGISPASTSDVFPGNATRSEIYANNAWFYLQMIANNGNGIGSSMLDWEYYQNLVTATSALGDHAPMRRLLVFTASMQLTGTPDEWLFRQWRPYFSAVDHRLELNNDALWAGIPLAERRQVQQAALDAWTAKNSRYSKSQYLFWPAIFDPGYVPSPAYKGGSLPAMINSTLRAAKAAGLRTRDAAAWAKTLWPASPAEWDKLAQ